METTFVKEKYVVNCKEIKFNATVEFNTKYGGIEAAMYTKIALFVLKKYPVDLLVFEMTKDGYQQVRLAGYNYNTHELDEETIAYKAKSLPTETFWLKLDDYGDYYVGTFLFPHEH